MTQTATKSRRLGRKPRPEKLVNTNEIAEMAQVHKNVVVNWKRRYSDFPTPAGQTDVGNDVYKRSEIITFLRDLADGRVMFAQNVVTNAEERLAKAQTTLATWTAMQIVVRKLR